MVSDMAQLYRSVTNTDNGGLQELLAAGRGLVVFQCEVQFRVFFEHRFYYLFLCLICTFGTTMIDLVPSTWTVITGDSLLTLIVCVLGYSRNPTTTTTNNLRLCDRDYHSNHTTETSSLCVFGVHILHTAVLELPASELGSFFYLLVEGQISFVVVLDCLMLSFLIFCCYNCYFWSSRSYAN